jgi:hypothetical protein
LYRQLIDRLAAMPGIEAAGISSSPPLTPASAGVGGAVAIERDGERQPVQDVAIQFVTPGFFAALGIAVHTSQPLSGTELARCAVIDRTLLERFRLSGDPLSATFVLGTERYPICGVVGSILQGTEDAVTGPTGVLYLPLEAFSGLPRWTFLVIRTRSQDPERAEAAVRAIAAANPTLLVEPPRSFGSLLRARTERDRRLSLLLSLMAGLALAFAAASVWASLQQLLARRSAEIAVRLCLGATRPQVAFVLGRWLLGPFSLGLTSGVALALAIGTTTLQASPVSAWATALPLAESAVVVVVTAGCSALGPLLRAGRVPLRDLLSPRPGD